MRERRKIGIEMKLTKSIYYHFQSTEAQQDLRNALSGRLCQQVIYGACVVVHALMIWFFFHAQVEVMAYYNIGSVLFYISFFIAVTRIKDKTVSLMDIAIAEIMVFSIASCVAVGWDCGFYMYLVCCVPAPFFMPYERYSTSIVTTALLTIGFVATKIYTNNPTAVTHPLKSGNERLVIYLMNSVFGMLMIGFMAFMFIVSRRVNMKLLSEKNEELTQIASIDPLTELFNRRAMTEYLKKVHETAENTGRTYAVVLGDIDNFKRINDRYGHSAGDLVLKKVSHTLTNCVPSEGYICRWGGEEILYVIPQCREERAELISENIRREIERLGFSSNNNTFKVSMTFGLVMADITQSYEHNINLADDYLYAGKENGKNMVVDKAKYEQLSAKS